MKVLIADDETDLRNAIEALIKHSGFDVVAAQNGKEALDAAVREGQDGFDVMVFDIMMPVMDGIEALKAIRQQGIMTPVILLTAKSEVEDRITGLDAGADDYLTKPFSMGELMARIRAAARRGSQTKQDKVPAVITFSNVSLDTEHSEMSAVNSISLALKELKLLEIFVSAPGKTYSSEELYGKVWSDEPDTPVKVVEMYVRYLQNKLLAVGANCTIAGDSVSGYKLSDKAA